MKPPRFTIRAMLIVIAIAALATGGYAMRIRSAKFTAEAHKHKIRLALERLNLRAIQYNSTGPLEVRMQRRQNLSATDEAEIAIQERWVKYEELLYHKYLRAARFPWLPLGLDPAPPTPPLG